MRINPCKECSEYIDIASDHDYSCSKYQGPGPESELEYKEK